VDRDYIPEKAENVPTPGRPAVIIDFKKLKTPPGPPLELRVAEEQAESELKSAGFTNLVSADKEMLPYQYIIRAR
jgi:hypothetical protein